MKLVEIKQLSESMTVTKTEGVGGEWIKTTIKIGEKTYTRTTPPNGAHQYANITNGGNTSIRSGGPSALKIDKAITAAL